jgi:uncharacterized surface anchored protein
VPCEAACGADFDYNIQSHVTFRDACNILVGNTTTPLTHFGFRQEAPIEQKNKVEYGTLTAGQSLTKNARFDFKFQQFNMDLTAATAELRIQYSKHMEFETNSLKFNGVAIAPSAIVQTGSNTGTISDVDSMVVYQLTATQITALFDNDTDSLSYSQTYYGCADRQTTNNGDFWQLLVRTKPTNCSDGSTPCSFDLSCRKPFAYGAGNACGVKPCYVTDYEFKRESKIGATDVTGTTPLLGAPSRAYEGDTIQFKMGSFITGDDVQEQNGYYTNLGRPDYDQRGYFAFTYSVPAGYNKESPWRFLPGYSTVVVRQRTPNPSNNLVLGTIGAVLFEAPLEIFDFQSYAGFAPTDNTGLPNGVTYTYPSASQPDYYGTPEWYCNNYPTVWLAEACPLQQTINYSNSFWSNRYWNVAKDKISEIYYINYGKALARAGWTTPLSDDNYYVEVRSKWRMNDQFPWDNTNSFSFKGSTQHLGNLYGGIAANTAASTYNSGCDDASTVGTVVSKKHYIANKNAVYNSTCGLTMCHKINFKSAAGDYFTGGEVRVPLKIDKIEVDLPTEYGITASTISLEYHQSGAIQTSTNIVGSASTGHVVFTKSGGGDFPRADDQSGFTTAYSLCYAVTKTGSAAATNYKIPIKIFTRDEFGTVRILTDTATIAEQQPNITITPLVPVTQNADGGACTPFYVDFLVENKSGYDAPNVYFAAESSASTIVKSIADGPNGYAFPLNAATDVSTYGATNLFAKLGTLRNGDERVMRVYSSSMICADSFKVYADFGCTYPSLLEPVYTSTTIDGATAKYVSLAPSILSRPIGDVNVANLCDVKTVEIELTNARFTNINKLVAGIKLPPNMTYVAGSAKLAYPSPFAAFTALAAADVAVVGTDSVTFTYNALAPFSGICGLEGADKSEINRIRIRFDVDFATCPAANLNQLVYTFTGENYCGKKTSNKGLVTFYYLGAIAGAKNNYDIKTSSTPLRVCAAQNATVPVSDTLFVKNIGGYGSASGASAATDSMVLRIKYDDLKLTMANLAFTNASASVTHSAGYVIIRMLVPAGVAVNSTITIPFTYDMTPLVPSLCTATPISYCVASEFSAPVALSCAAKGLTCSALSKSFRGIDLNTRVFDCCKAKIGNYVWLDVNANGLQDDGVTAGINGVTVELYKETAPGSGTYTLVQNTITANDATGNAGAYSFEVTDAANYYVKFPTTNATNILTTPTATAATDANSDADNTGKSPIFAMDPNAIGITNQNPTIDCGYQPVGSVGNFVWTDANGNGLQDDGAASGINGVTVELWSVGADGVFGGGDDVLSQTTTTANDGSGNPGYYNFIVSTNGNYFVKFPTTSGTNVITKQTETAATDGNSDANAGGFSPVFPININGTGVAKDNPTIDAGYKSIASLGNYVWLDEGAGTNARNGTQDADEVGVAGIIVTLYNNAGAAIATTKTDAYGKYLFTELQPGDYTVGFSLPANYVFTTRGSGMDSGTATDSDVDASVASASFGRSRTITLSGGENDLNVDAGIYFAKPTTASVGDYVWLDTNGDGVQDAGEKGVSGVTVTLYDNLGNPVVSTVTDGNGGYLFSDVTPGTYTIGFTPLPGLLFTTGTGGTADTNDDTNPATGKTNSFVLGAGEEKRNIDAGLIEQAAAKAALGDRVWYDTNNNGIQDAGETGVAGVTVELYDAAGTGLLATTKTDALGNYIFNNLDAGAYTVKFVTSTLPSGYVLTAANQGASDAADTDANTSTGFTGVYTLVAGEKNMTVDAGIFNSTLPTGSIGDYVWNDANKDGVQDANEVGIAGVTVKLYDNGVLIATTTTDKNGHYTFPNLGASTTYQVEFTNLPTGYAFSPNTAGTAATGSDANPTTGRTPMITLATGENKTDLDAGLYPSGTPSGKGSLGDVVWYDLNNNGVQDAGEPGVNGVTVTLYAANGTTVLATQKTDPTGHYLFTGLDKGDYIVGFDPLTLPSGFVFTAKDQGTNDATDTDVNIATGKTDLISLAQGEDKLTVDAGIYKTGKGALGNFVWNDLNNDGVQNLGEPGVSGVGVQLLDAITGAVLATTTTDANGFYLFPNLDAGSYKVQFTNLPDGFTFAPKDATANGGDDTNDSDVDATGTTPTIVLAAAEVNLTVDAGIHTTTKAGLGDYVWFDTNANGVQEVGEKPIAGVLVTLYDNTNTPVATTITDANGWYSFLNLDPGTYTVGFDNLPKGTTFTKQDATTNGGNDTNDSDVNPATGRTGSLTLAAGDFNSTLDAGVTNEKAGLGNYVWLDTDKDGIQDANEKGVAGVKVTLYAANGTTVMATTETDGNGFYSFTNLNPGDYKVGFDISSQPAGTQFTTKDATLVGGNDTNDSDVDATTGGLTPLVTLAAGEFNSTLDAGVQKALASLGDYVWLDEGAGANARNGIQDADEVGVAGVTVTLYDNTGKAIATTKTDAYGKYLFADLAPGDYSVGFSLPTNYVFSPKGSGTDSGTATDSDVEPLGGTAGFGRTNTITLSVGENDMKVDAGIYFANPIKQSIGDYVWFDANNDGAQDANEKGVSGVTVTLYDAAGTTVIATTITDGNGKYLFDNLPIGSYTLGFGDMPGMGFTTQNSGNATGSDADPATGKTGVITLNTGDNLRDIDAGFVPNSPLKCAIGDKVWYDVNNDGIQNDSSPLGGAGGGAGVAGVTVNLLDGTGAVVATTKTDALGNYLFDNLDAGRYKVQFDATTLPAGYTLVAKDAAAATDYSDADADPTTGSTTWYVLAPGDKNLTVDAGIFKATAPTGGLGNFVWLDADKDGVQDTNETGLGGVTVTLYAADGITKIATTVTDKTGYYSFVNLPAADYVVGFTNMPEGFVFTNQTNGTTDGSDVNPSTGKTPPITVGTTFVETVDAGLYPSGTASGKGSLGDIVWYDTNDNGLQDATEVGVNGVTVTLYAANGTTVLATQKTDATGHYLFTGLDKGDFVVGFSNLPAGFTFTTKDAGTNDAVDTDVNAASGKTDVVSLAQGEDKLTVDAGIYNATPGAPIGAIGNFVWNDLDGDGIQNDGAESGISGISVVLYDSNNNIVATTTTDAKGYYLFPNLPFGDYKVGFGNLPEGFNFTTPNVFGSTAANGSDADPNSGLTPTITLSAGTPTNMNVDAGIRTTTKAGLGDFVWLDANANGIQDVGEKTLPGVLVTLYAADGTTKIASTVTDRNGHYSFVNLDPAIDYVVGFSNLPLGATFTTPNAGGSTTANDSDVLPSTGKTGVINLNPGEFNNTIDAGVTTEKAGLGNYVWLDANANGTQDAGEKPVAAVTVSLYDSATNTQIAKTVTDGNGYYSFTGLNPGVYYVVFEPTTLPQGATFTTQTNGTSTGSDADMTTGQTPTVILAAGEFNPNIDAGILQNKAGLGAYVWIDADKNGLQESTEIPLPNVKVYLYSATNPTVKMDSTTTDAKGFYWFGNLTPGDYIVGFDKVTGYTRTTPNGMVGGLPTGETPFMNSDANATSGLTTAITLAAGERNTSIAAGYYQTTLPVKLLYFKGEVDACTINLTWSTATEQNSKSFEVWRSNDGVHYTKIGELKSAGNSTTQKFYAFADAKPLRNNYYKLVQIDMDGASETYNLANKVSTNGCFEETDNGISGIFPNPNATNEVSVKFYTDRNDSEAVDFAIYDAFGRKIQTYARTITRGANLINLDITDLPTGVYYVKVIGNGWYSLSQKLVRVQ